MPAARNHYQILNVAPDAEPVVIEAAYRALMKKYHPDQAVAAAGEGPSAAQINHAFATLRDAGRRADYDRREWTKGQDIQLAATRPPPTAQRVSRVFGWGGWVVAAILGGVLTLIAGRADEVALARAQATHAAMSSEPDLRTQPTLPDEPFVAPEPPVAVPAGPAEVAPPAAVREAEAAEEKLLRAPPATQLRKAAKAKVRRPVAPAQRPRTKAERDFLERQGYIY